MIVDLGVPRNIHPSVGGLEGTHLLNLDDLEQITQQGRQSREACIADAESLIAQELDKFQYYPLEMTGRQGISQILADADALCESELAKWIRKHPEMSPEVRDRIEEFSQGLVRKLLFHPIASIHRAIRKGDADQLNTLLHLWMEE